MDTPAKSSPLKRGSFFTSKIFIILVLLFLISFSGSGVYVMQSRQQESTPSQQKELLQLPSFVSSILNPNLTSDWETFTNADYGYTINHPKGMPLWGDPEYYDDIQFGEHIFITVYD